MKPHPKRTLLAYKLSAVLFLSFVSLSGLAVGQLGQRTLNLLPMSWKAYAGGGCAVKVISTKARIKKYRFNCDGKREAFPHLSMDNSGQSDWRIFNRLELKLRLNSNDKGIQADGEHVTVCLYDRELRHVNMPGTPMVQQVVGSFTLHTGDWQTIDLNLCRVQCSDVQSLDIYVYEMPYAYPHRFEVGLAKAMLIGAGSNQVCFDSHIYSDDAITGCSGKSVGSIKTSDGLELQVGSRGGIVQWLINGSPYGNGRKQASGIMLRDTAAGTAPMMVGGKVVSEAGRIIQRGTVKKLALKLNATYVPSGDQIVVNGTVTSLRAGDRAVTVYFALPVKAINWKWSEGLTRSNHPFQDAHTVPNLEERITGYPVCALSAPHVAGITLGIRLDQPTVYRFAINPAQRLLYVAFDFALIDGCRSVKQSLSSAHFSLVIYRHDPQWGIRSALERYYHFYPTFFTNRIKRAGGWDYNEATEAPKHIISCGYRFDWGVNPSDAKWNHEHGVLSLLYIEPEFLQFSLGDYQKPTAEDAWQRLVALCRGNNVEWNKFMKLHYTQAGCGHDWSKNYSGLKLRQFLLGLMNAAHISAICGVKDKPILGISGNRAWIGNSDVGAMIPCDLNPRLPGGLGAFNYEHCMAPCATAMKSKTGVPIDGFALDSFDLAPNDYCPEHFKYSTSPLSFDPNTKKPMIPSTFSTVEWLKWMSNIYHPQGKVFMANIFGPVTFSAPYIDIFGNESPEVRNPGLLRSLAYHRPITYLPYFNQPIDSVQYNLLWDIYPGRGIDSDVLAPMIPVLDKLYRAGWEPVTWAKASPGTVRVERFGAGRLCYLSLYNCNRKAVKAKVDVDWKRLAIKKYAVKMEYPDSEDVSQTTNGFNVIIKPMKTIVIRLGSETNGA